MILSKSTLLALLPFFLAAPSHAVSGSGQTTRYWDCCKPSCAWSGKASLKTGPVESCDANNNVLTDVDTKSGCDGGSAYMCSDESPWAVSDSLAYGFAAVSISGGTEASWCCACYELTFTSGPVSGKKMVVQATNTGGDLGTNHFDLAVRIPFPFLALYSLPTYFKCLPNSLLAGLHPTLPQITPKLTPPDARRRLRYLQRLHPPIRHPLHRLGRAIRRRHLTQPMRRLPRSPQSRLLLALGLVPERRQPHHQLPERRVSTGHHE